MRSHVELHANDVRTERRERVHVKSRIRGGIMGWYNEEI